MVDLCQNTDEDVKKRVERMHKKLSEEPEIRLFPNKKGYDGIICTRAIDWAANCEHHLVGIVGKAYIGYIPNSDYYVGASKLARMVEKYLNPIKNVTQEDANVDIINMIDEKLKPEGVICILVGKHICMSHRGVKQPNADMLTSQIRGAFKKPEVRAEFFELLKLRGVMS